MNYLKFKLEYFILATLMIMTISTYPTKFAYAHNFSTTESASFISLVDQIRSSLSTISQYDSADIASAREQAQYARMLVNDTVIKELNERNERIASQLPQELDSLQNISLEELKNSVDHINDLLSEAISVRIDVEDLENATVQALAVAENTDNMFELYNIALNKSSSAMDMSMGMSNDSNGMDMSMGMSNDSNGMDMSMGMSNDSQNVNETIKNNVAYDRANALVDFTIDRFNNELEGKSQNASAAQAAIAGLEQFKISMQNKDSIEKTMGILHGEIHPNLQVAFGLQLAGSKTEMNHSSMSMSDSMEGMNDSMKDGMDMS
jgi:hypothetical protein